MVGRRRSCRRRQLKRTFAALDLPHHSTMPSFTCLHCLLQPWPPTMALAFSHGLPPGCPHSPCYLPALLKKKETSGRRWALIACVAEAGGWALCGHWRAATTNTRLCWRLPGYPLAPTARALRLPLPFTCRRSPRHRTRFLYAATRLYFATHPARLSMPALYACFRHSGAGSAHAHRASPTQL